MFGTTQVLSGGRRMGLRDLGGVKPRQILEILALHRGHPVPKELLVDLVWDGRPPRDAMATLESYVCQLRRNLQPSESSRRSIVVTGPGCYYLDTERVQIDLMEFDRLVDPSLSTGSADLPRLLVALDLVRGDVLEHEPYVGWTEPVRSSYRVKVIDTMVRAGAWADQLGDHARAIELATAATERDALREDGWRLLMTAHLHRGDRPSGVRAYAACRRILATELAVSPSQDTTDLGDRLLLDEPTPLLDRGGAVALDVDSLAAAALDAVRARLARPDAVDGARAWEAAVSLARLFAAPVPAAGTA